MDFLFQWHHLLVYFVEVNTLKKEERFHDDLDDFRFACPLTFYNILKITCQIAVVHFALKFPPALFAGQPGLLALVDCYADCITLFIGASAFELLDYVGKWIPAN